MTDMEQQLIDLILEIRFKCSTLEDAQELCKEVLKELSL
jgi:hypothetical protein